MSMKKMKNAPRLSISPYQKCKNDLESSSLIVNMVYDRIL